MTAVAAIGVDAAVWVEEDDYKARVGGLELGQMVDLGAVTD